MVVNMGKVGEFTDYKEFFQSLPAGVIVGAALFALALVLLVVSSIFQAIVNRCCSRKEENTSHDREAGVVIESGARNSFDNPVYKDSSKTRPIVTQEHEISVSSTDGNTSSVIHDYENATHLKKRLDSEPDLEYENLNGQTIEQPDNGISDMYDRPKPSGKKTTQDSENDDDELPDYDVPKTFTGEDEDEAPDYDVPKHFTN